MGQIETSDEHVHTGRCFSQKQVSVTGSEPCVLFMGIKSFSFLAQVV